MLLWVEQISTISFRAVQSQSIYWWQCPAAVRLDLLSHFTHWRSTASSLWLLLGLSTYIYKHFFSLEIKNESSSRAICFSTLSGDAVLFGHQRWQLYENKTPAPLRWELLVISICGRWDLSAQWPCVLTRRQEHCKGWCRLVAEDIKDSRDVLE